MKMGTIKQMLCNHEAACIPVKDSTDWVIGELCTKCFKFWERENMPSYRKRMEEKMSLHTKNPHKEA